MTVRFRGRELTHPEIGRTLLAKFGDAVKDHGAVDRAPILEGKSMFMTLASVHKPRVHEHRIASPRPDGEEPLGPGEEPELEEATGEDGTAPAAPVADAAAAHGEWNQPNQLETGSTRRAEARARRQDAGAGSGASRRGATGRRGCASRRVSPACRR